MAEYLIDQIFPRNEVHLLGGPSGAGKTTWLFQTLIDDWQQSKPVLGYNSFPVPWVYISGDRSGRSALRTLHRCGYAPGRLRLWSAVDMGRRKLLEAIPEVLKLEPRPQLIVVEGIATMLPKGMSYNRNEDVAEFLTHLTRGCQLEDLDILGIVHSPKMKEGMRYLNPRERIMGAAAWAGYSETIVLIEPDEEATTEASSLRKLGLLPRNAPVKWLSLQFNKDGRLVEVDASLNDALFDGFLGSMKAGTEFKRADAVKVLGPSMSESTIDRMLKAALDQGYLDRRDKLGYGVRHKI
jgi:hypothetical protein